MLRKIRDIIIGAVFAVVFFIILVAATFANCSSSTLIRIADIQYLLYKPVINVGELQYVDSSYIKDFDRSELYWLTMNIYHESRGENPFGMLLVAFVTLDRLYDGRWGNTIKEVVTSPCQFSWYSDGKSDIPTDRDAWEESKKVALFAQMVFSPLKDVIDINHYHNKSVNPEWADDMEPVFVVGNHIFYQERD